MNVETALVLTLAIDSVTPLHYRDTEASFRESVETAALACHLCMASALSTHSEIKGSTSFASYV